MSSIHKTRSSNLVAGVSHSKRFGLASTTALVPAALAFISAAALVTPRQAYAQATETVSYDGDVRDTPLVLNSPVVIVTATIFGTNFQNGVVSESGGPSAIEMHGPGRVVFTADNTFSGGVTTVGGLLAFTKDSALGAPTGNVTIGDGDFLAVDPFTTNRQFTLVGSGKIGANPNRLFTIAGSIVGSGALNIRDNSGGTNPIELTGNNSYLGGTNVGAATLIVGSDANLGAASGGVTLTGGQFANSTFRASASFATGRTFTIARAPIFNTGAGITLTLDGLVEGTGSLNKTGAGTVVLSGTNTYSGGTAIGEGTLEVQDGGTLGTGDVLNNGTLSFNNANAMSVGNVVSGSGGLTKSGTGTLTLMSDNTYTGSTVISAGTLMLGNGGTTGTIADGSGGLTVDGTLAFNRSNALTFASSFGGSGSLRQIGPGTTTLSGNVILAGSVSVESGILELSGSNTISGGITVGGGTLRLGSNFGAGGAGGTIRTTGSVIDYANGVNMPTPIELNSDTTQLQVSTGAATQSGNISETGGARPLEKIGAGRLTLSGTNSYSGGTTISAGTLAFTSDANLGTATGGITIGDATLSLTAAANITANRAFNLTGNAGIEVASNGTYTIAGDITGAGNLTKALSGTLILTGTNSYAGTTTVNQGTLQIGDGGAIGTLGAGAVIANSALIFNRSDDFTVANDIGGGGSLTKTGGGTLTLTGAKTYVGQTSIIGGTLVFGGTSAYTGGGSLTVNGGNFTLGVDATFSSASQSNSVVDLGGNTMTLLTGNYSLNGGSITGSGTIDVRNNNRGLLINTASAAIGTDVTINGAGGGTPFVQLNMSADYSLLPTITGANLQLRLFNTDSRTTVSGNNSFGGGTVLSTGTAVVASNTALGTGTLTMAANTGLEAGGTGNRTLANAITLNGTGISIANPSTTNTFTLGGVIGGTNGFAKTGAGTLILTGANTYSGGTTVGGGTLQIGSGSLAGSLGTGSVTIGTSGTLAFNSSASQNVNNNLGGTGSVPGSLIKAGSGTLTLGGTNTFTGPFSLNGGSLQLTGGSAFGDTAALSMAAGTALGVDTSETIGSLSGNGTVVLQAGAVLTTGGNNNSTTFAGALSGLGGLTKTGTGTLSLTGTSTFAGTTTISAGTLQVGDNGTTGAINGGPIVNNASLVFNRSDNIDTLVAISGTGTLTKLGAGTLTLTAANSYAGGTTISGGVLQLGSGSNAASLGTGGVTISSGTTLRSNSSATQTISGALAGTGSLVHQGTGTTILNSAANGYSGTAQIFAGTLQLGNLTALGTGAVQMRGGSLHLASAGTYGNNINSFTADGNVVSTAASSTVTLTGQIGGAGTLRLAPGAGSTLDIASSSASAGATTRIIVQSGTVRSQNGVLGLLLAQTDTQTQVDAGATLDFNTRLSTISNLSGAGTILNDGSTTTLRNGTFSGAFGGMQSLATTGNITLSGASTYSGTTTVQSGTLTIGSSGALGTSAAGTTVNSGGTLLITGSSPTLVLADALTISGTGNGGIGAVRIEPNANPGNQGVNLTGGVTLAADATITVADRMALIFSTSGIVLGSSTLTFASEGTGNSSTFVNSAISGTGGLIKNGPSLVNLNGANTFTGSLTINGGDIGLTGGAALADTVAVSMAANTRLFVNSPETIGSLAGTGSVILQNGTSLTTGGNDTSTTFAGTIAGNGNFTKAGLGTFILTGANTYSGSTTISGGTLQIGNGGTTGAIGGGPFINDASLVINRSNNIDVNATISGTGTLTKQGTGTLTLTAANSYTGLTQVDAGTLAITNALALGTGAAGTVVASGASLLLSGPIDVQTEAITISGNGVANSGALRSSDGSNGLSLTTITLASDARINSDGALSLNSIVGGGNNLTLGGSGLLTINNNLSGIGSLTVDGAGQKVLFAGTVGGPTVVNNGVLTITGSASLSDTGLVTVNLPGSLSFNVSDTIGAIEGNGSVSINDVTLTTGNSNSSTVLLGTLSGNGGLTKVGTGTFTLGGNNTLQGPISIEGGTLQIGNGSSLGSLGTGAGAVVVGAAGTLAFNRTGTLTATNAISGAGTIRQIGSGTTVLSGDAGAFSGSALVEAGNLRVNGAFGGDIAVGSGTLGGIGTISGVVTIGNGGTLAAGQSPGTLSVGSLTLDTGSTTSFELAEAGVAGGANNDLIRVTGNLALNGGTINVVRGAGFSTGQYTLFEFGTLSGALGNLALDPLGGGFIGNLALGTGTVLLNAATAADFVYWNGSTTTSAGSLVGGSGTWDLLGNNFSNASGTVGGPWTGNGALAVFGGASGGTVTIAADTTLSPSGVNFLTDGYLITGANAGSGLALSGPTGIDTASGVSATIAAAMTGTGSVTKTGAGTLTLSGTNTYGGSTTVLGGTLVNSGTITGQAINNATLTSTGSLLGGLTNNTGGMVNIAGTARGAIDNSGTITVTGNLTSDAALTNSQTGVVTVATGTTWSGLTSVVNSGTAADAFTVNGTLSVAGSVNNAANARLTIGTGGSLTAATGVDNAAAGTIVNAGAINSAIANSGSLTSTGSLLGGLTNDAGATAALQGVLSGTLSNSGSIVLTGNLSGGAAVSQTTSGSFTVAGFEAAIGSLAGNGTVSMGGGTLMVGSDASTTSFGGVVDGTGSLIKVGAGMLTLTGANTFAGTATVDGGALALASGGSLAGAVQNDATFTNDGSVAGLVTNNGTLVSTGVLSGGLANTAGATAQLANAVSGTISNAGAITLTARLAGDATMTQTETGVLDLAGFGATLGSLAGSGVVTLGAGTLTVGANGASTSFDGVISGSGSVVKIGAGTLTLTGTNSYNGTTQIDAGGLALGSGAVLAGQVNNRATFTSAGMVNGAVANGSTFVSTGTINGNLSNAAGGTASLAGQLNGDVANAGAITQTGLTTGIDDFAQEAGGTLDLGGFAMMIGSLAGSGTIALGSGDLIVGSNGADTRFDGVITGTARLAKTGSATLTLGGASSYTGLTTIGGGTLSLANGGALAGGVTNNATFANAGTVAGLVTNTGTLVSAGALNGGLTNAGGASATLGGSVGGSVDNAGTLFIASGTTLAASPLANTGQVLNAGGWTGDVTNNAGATIENTAAGSFIGAFNNRGTLLSAGAIVGPLTNGGTAQLAGTVTGPMLNSGEVVSSGNLAHTGEVNNSGLFTVAAGNFVTSGTFTNSGSLFVSSGATMALGTAILRNSGSSALIDVAGTLRGRIDLASGTLIGRPGSLLAGDVLVASGATFMGGGTITGTATINGTLMPGNSPGTLTVNGALALGGSSTTVFEMTETMSDRIDVNGTATIASGATLVLTGVRAATPGQSYTLISTTGGITGSFTNVVKDRSVFGFIRQDADSIDLLGTLTLPAGVTAQGTATIDYLNERLLTGTVSEAGLALTPALAALDGSAVAPAIARLSPEPYASAATMALESGLVLAKTVRSVAVAGVNEDDGGLFVFGQGFAAGRDIATHPFGTAPAAQAGEGFLGGVGYGTSALGVSAFVGRSSVRQEIVELGGQTRSRGTFFGGKVQAATGGLRFTASAIFDRSDADTSRAPVGGAAQGRYTLHGETFDAELAYDVPIGAGGPSLRPSAGITHSRVTRGAVVESGGGASALTVVRQTYKATWINGEIALRAASTSAVQPWVGVGVRHLANGDPIRATGTLAGFGGQFTVEGAKAKRTFAHASGGASAKLARGLSVYLTGEVDAAPKGGALQIQGGIRYAF